MAAASANSRNFLYVVWFETVTDNEQLIRTVAKVCDEAGFAAVFEDFINSRLQESVTEYSMLCKKIILDSHSEAIHAMLTLNFKTMHDVNQKLARDVADSFKKCISGKYFSDDELVEDYQPEDDSVSFNNKFSVLESLTEFQVFLGDAHKIVAK